MKSKKLFAWDNALLLAIATAGLYYFYFLYLYYYFQTFGVKLVDLHLSLQEVLMTKPSLVITLIIIVVVDGLYIWRDLQTTEAPQPKSKPSKTWNRIISFLTLLAIAAAIGLLGLWVWWIAERGATETMRTNPPVVFAENGKVVEGYCYLTRSDDYLYFYKMVDGRPQTLMVRAEEVKEVSFGKDLP